MGVSFPGEVLRQQSRVVQQVMVECPGFATVKFDAPSQLCSCELGADGTTVECHPDSGASYTIFPKDRNNPGLYTRPCQGRRLEPV